MTAIDLVLRPTAHDIGGFEVRRALPSRERRMVGPFIFFDHMGPAQLDPGHGLDVRPHPHINLSTVTYLFDGAIDHRDSLGTFRTIEPGAVNLMTAGKGIVHSERSPQALRAEGPRLHGIQTWLALPRALEEIDPAFEHVPAADLPKIEGDGFTATLIMGASWGKTSPVTTYHPTLYADLALQTGACVPIDPDAEERALYVVSGHVSVDGDGHAAGEMLVLKPGARLILLAETGSRVMLLGGATMDGERHLFWNFVSSRRERIEAAKADWRAGRFPRVPGDEEEFIPLPGDPDSVRHP